MASRRVELQAHRGARFRQPENTLPAFEAALDLGVTSLETDVHLTADRVPILSHDPALGPRLCQALPGAPQAVEHQPLLCTLSVAQLRHYRVVSSSPAELFPRQPITVPPLAAAFAAQEGWDPYVLPTLDDLIRFLQAYAGPAGQRAGKTPEQQQRAARVRLDLELKRVPFRPEWLGDDYCGQGPGDLERQVVACLRRQQFVARCRVRSFDHRAVAAIRQLEPALETAVLLAGAAPQDTAALVRAAGASVYCPEFTFLDALQVAQLHAQGLRVLPWTVNEERDAERLLSWGVDGITTDFPERLQALWRRQGLDF
jgi:glycerophosphoryl diester phosphodiesterase